MEIISKQVCAKCDNLKRCISIAVDNPELQVKCIHFGYVTEQVNQVTNAIKTQFEEYMDYLLGNKEN